MAKQIIALQRSSDGTTETINVAFWYSITSGAGGSFMFCTRCSRRLL